MTLVDRLWDIPIRSYSDPNGVYHNVGNGCISRTKDGYVLINRIQNYHTSLGRHHPSQKLKVQTISFAQWIDLDMDYNIVGSHIIDQSLVYRKSIRPVKRQLIVGLEDMRLFRQGGQWWFTASTGHFEVWNDNQFWGQCLGVLSPDTKSLYHVIKLSYDNRRIMEKNWLPFCHNGIPHLLYESNPMTILHPKITTGKCEVVYTGEKYDMPVMRGSGSPIPWGNRYLYTIHEQGILRGELPLEDRYFYFHRFVEMDDSFKITRLSPLFTFREEGVEYTCGHCLSHDGKTLIVPYSSANGTDSNLMGISVQTVESMLNQ